MSDTTIRNMSEEDEIFVATCSHLHESEEIDVHGERRLAWLRGQYRHGLRVKVALREGEHVGWLHVIPIEICPWGPQGEDLMVVPCLTVQKGGQRQGIGEALLAAAEEETRRQGRKGLVIPAYDHEFWFMPVSYFLKRGYEEIGRRDSYVLLWKRFGPDAEAPRLLTPSYVFEPVPGKVLVELFYNDFCLTSGVEAQRVRDVAAEYGDEVLLRQYRAEDAALLASQHIPRAIYVNGKSIGWGYEAPREGIRAAIDEALQKL